MLDNVKDELRATLNAVRNMRGQYSEHRIVESVERVQKYNLIDDWMRSNCAIFIHIPKAAGSSVKRTLKMAPQSIPHIPAEAYRRADPEFFAKAHTFSIARNPWDRLVSSFHYVHTSNHKFEIKMRRLDMRGNADFSVFLDRLKSPLFRNRILTRMHFMPQAHYLCDSDNRLIVDMVGRFENLPHSFNEVTAPMAQDYALESHNRGKHKDFREYYIHDWQIELVGQMFAEDCRLLGYSFENSPLDTIKRA